MSRISLVPLIKEITKSGIPLIKEITKSGKRKTIKAWKPEGSEHQHQVALFRWAALNERKYPELELLYAIPNGGYRHIAVARKLKAEGVRAGVPDMCLPVACRGYHGLYIELKAPKGKVSPVQREWITGLRAQGYCVDICYGWVEAREAIEVYLQEKEE